MPRRAVVSTPPRLTLSRRYSLAAGTLAAFIALGLAGCTTPTARPAVEVPGRYVAAPESIESPEAAWWQSYGDPVLADLVRRAAQENRDIKVAAERVLAAQAGAAVSRSWLWPNVAAGASGFKFDNGYDLATRQLVPDAKGGSAGLGVSWEVDLSGRLRAGVKASEADALATAHAARGVRLLVVSEVARNYFVLVGALRQLETTRAISDAQQETLRLVMARERAGLASTFDLERARTEAERTRAQIPPLETLVSVSRHRIAVLTGDQAANAGNIAPYEGNIAVPPALPGQPADLLQRRPDLLALQAQLDAANARRQQAHAEWFPRLLLGAAFGTSWLELNGSDLGSTHFANAVGLLAMPLFTAGRTRAMNEIAESGQSEAVLRYEDGIVRALEDVENSLVALRDEGQRNAALQAAAASADAALGRARSLYNRGQIDLLPLLDAQRAQLAARSGAVDSNTRLLLDSVQLYKSLGGGWQVFEPSRQPADAVAAPAPRS